MEKTISEYDNVVQALAEQREQFEKNNIYNLPISEDEKIFEAKQYDSLRKIPFYKDLLPENFYRMCDLFMSSRVIRKKKDIREEDLIPQLPKPEDLKPFPTMESIVYLGHSSSVVAMCVDPNGKFLISADSAGFIMFWDIDTTKIVKRITVSDDVIGICFNAILQMVTIICKENVYFMLPPYLDRKTRSEIDGLIESKVLNNVNDLK